MFFIVLKSVKKKIQTIYCMCLGIKTIEKQKLYTGLARDFLGCGPLKSFLAEASITHFGALLSG